jgi:diguanylate cyclase (GGDEF)-like protein
MAVLLHRPATRAVVALTAIAVLAASFALGSILNWGSGPPAVAPDTGHTLADLMGDFGLSAVAALAAVSCVARALTVVGRLRLSWLLFAASALVAGLGNGVWGWYELVLHRVPPSPSLADWVFLFFAPFAMAATLVHHRGPGSAIAWVKLVLDGAMISGALFTAGWSVALARDADTGGGSPLKLALTLAYPVFDILLVSLVLSVRFQGGRRDGASMATLVFGYSVIVICDAIWTIPSVRAGYSSGDPLDAGWFLGYLLLVAAPWMTGWTGSEPGARPPHRIRASITLGVRRALGLLGLLFPYLAGAICLFGIMVDGLTGDHRVHPVLLTTGGAVLTALAIRQGVTLLENNILTRELAVREDHFRSLVQGSSDVIMTLDPGGTLGYVSPAVAHVFGYDPQKLSGSSVYQLVHPEDRRAVAAALARFLRGSAASSVLEFRIRATRPPSVENGTCENETSENETCENGTSPWRHAESTLTRHRGGLVFTCRDVSDRIALQEQLAYNAYHDSLTGLPNRAMFAERLEQAVAQHAADRMVGHMAVLFLDLDWFKAVNDAGGHAVGDALLAEAAARLRGAVRVADTVARFGGDEFAALVQGGSDGRTAQEVAGRLHAALTRPYRIRDGRYVVGASIGIAFWRPGITAAELMREADAAMYEAKAGGKGRVVARQPQTSVRVE